MISRSSTGRASVLASRWPCDGRGSNKTIERTDLLRKIRTHRRSTKIPAALRHWRAALKFFVELLKGRSLGIDRFAFPARTHRPRGDSPQQSAQSHGQTPFIFAVARSEHHFRRIARSIRIKGNRRKITAL